jgi:F-type H+-transporting ATPase subunit a
MKEVEAIFELHLFGLKIGITSSILVQWAVIIFAAILSIVLTRTLKKLPDKKQTVLEMFVSAVGNVVKENMGDSYKAFTPFIGTLALYILLMNLVPLLGVKAPTEDLSVTLGMALITFVLIQGYTIKKVGLLHYITGFGKPYAALAPMNLIERVMLPVSLSLRLFGNLTAGAVIMNLVYEMLMNINYFAALVIPIPLHFYFDIFDGGIQTIIFVMLTMINLKIIAEH